MANFIMVNWPHTANWPAIPREKYLTRDDVFSVVALGFIGCYGDVRWRCCWRGETETWPQSP